MILSKTLSALALGLWAVGSAQAEKVLSTKREQDIVTWDDHSLFINGERTMLYSAEIHPFRLPVPSLWLDVLQKIKAAGYNCVSIYIDWQLLEGERGTFRADEDGIFSQQGFFKAARQAGLYVIARPGPYINAEVSGGGFPGWLSRVEGVLRSNETGYMDATDLYMREVGGLVADAQITNGGPVVLVQVENEYTSAADGYHIPNYDYWDKVKKQYTDAGIVVPLINNEAHMSGYITTSTPANIDIYGFDGYPLGFDCDSPDAWPDDGIDESWLAYNNELAPDSPLSILEVCSVAAVFVVYNWSANPAKVPRRCLPGLGCHSRLRNVRCAGQGRIRARLLQAQLRRRHHHFQHLHGKQQPIPCVPGIFMMQRLTNRPTEGPTGAT